MRSQRPKPLHRLCGRPMVLHVLDALAELDVDRVVVVVGHRGEWVSKSLDRARADGRSRSSSSSRPSSSAPATPRRWRSPGSRSTPRSTRTSRRRRRPARATRRSLRPPTLAALVRHHREHDAGGDAAHRRRRRTRPATAGSSAAATARVVRIVEEADATDEEREITEVNTSIYCFRRSAARPGAAPAQPGQLAGRVLPDRRRRRPRTTPGTPWTSVIVADPMEAAGVNDRAQLAAAEAELRDRINERWMRRGVTMWDPAATYVDADVQLAEDVVAAARHRPARALPRSARAPRSARTAR